MSNINKILLTFFTAVMLLLLMTTSSLAATTVVNETTISSALSPYNSSLFNNVDSPGLYLPSQTMDTNYSVITGTYDKSSNYIYTVYAHKTTYEIYVRRLNFDGSLDTSFSNNGILDTGFTLPSSSMLNGGVYINTDSNSNFYLSYYDTSQDPDVLLINKFNTSGVMVSSFGVNGTTIITAPNDINFDGGLSIAMNNDKLIITERNEDLYFARVNTSDGSLDSSFGVNGVFVFDATEVGAPNVANSAAPLLTSTDDIFISISYSIDGNNTYRQSVINLTSTGQLNNNFDSDGIKLLSSGDTSNSINFMPLNFINDKLYIMETKLADSSGASTIFRYNNDGILDTTFANNGSRIFSGANDELIIPSVVREENGKYYVFISKIKPLVGGAVDLGSLSDITYSMNVYNDENLSDLYTSASWSVPLQGLSDNAKVAYVFMGSLAALFGDNNYTLGSNGVAFAIKISGSLLAGAMLNLNFKTTTCTKTTTTIPGELLNKKTVRGKSKRVKISSKNKPKLRLTSVKAYDYSRASSLKLRFKVQVKKKGKKKFSNVSLKRSMFYWKVPGKKNKYKKFKKEIKLSLKGLPTGKRSITVKGKYKGKNIKLRISVPIKNPGLGQVNVRTTCN